MGEQKITVKRHPERGTNDREVIDAILDEAMFCHVGFVDEGLPYVVPTIHVRVGDDLILHGSPASRMMRLAADGTDLCVTVTLLDGLVLARSVFDHSMNYRSAMVFGRAAPIDDPDLKMGAMRAFTDKILPGRWGDARPPSDKEFRATLMVGLRLDTATAKVRTGPPSDAPEDADRPVWAGVIPYGLVPGTPVPAPDLDPDIEFPSGLAALLGLE